jgi:hypothetical protein
MDKIIIEIENCYGINKLVTEFDFTNRKSTHAIYAPNGVMKTSFANVFDDFSRDQESRDLVYPSRVSKRILKDSTGNQISNETIFVIRPYESSFKSGKMATLLVNEELRKKYLEIHESIDKEKDTLIKALEKTSGIKSNIEQILSETFTDDRKSFFTALVHLEKEIVNEAAPLYSHIKYKLIFDEKVLDFLSTGDFRNQIKQYIEKYEELIKSSTFLKKDFNHYHATAVQKNLSDNGFFKAAHSINLNVGSSKTEIVDENEFNKLIQGERERILQDSVLKTIFDNIDKKISNAQLREFRDYLFENQDILIELSDIHNFKTKLWISFLKSNLELYQNLLSEFIKGQAEIKVIIDQAHREKTDWENVIHIFNKRFYVPYKLSISNKADAILSDEAPSIHYHFNNTDHTPEEINEDLLLRVLSQGEKRALYLLHIIFEIESRRKQGIVTLFVIDDIADSFDYKNKYAIIEYLREISNTSIFRSIILTHNFDFFRTIQDRVMGGERHQNSYMAIKEQDHISLIRLSYNYISNPFNEWKSDLSDQRKLIASITFARNIAEYLGDYENINKLTALLHIKPSTRNLKIKDLEVIYKNIFKDMDHLQLEEQEMYIIDLIFGVAQDICDSITESGLNLENKIVLSIAIRLSAEIYMINKINDNSFVSQITSSQTGKLFRRYKKLYTEDFRSLEILEKVNIMTPENIHLNSFMYEPILDMSDSHLKDLYIEVNQLILNEELSAVQVAAGSSNE